MLEVAGAITIGLIATAVIVVLLQIAFETLLAAIGYWRFWRCMFRRAPAPPAFPLGKVLWGAITWKIDIGGDYILGGVAVPCDPRKPIHRRQWFVA